MTNQFDDGAHGLKGVQFIKWLGCAFVVWLAFLLLLWLSTLVFGAWFITRARQSKAIIRYAPIESCGGFENDCVPDIDGTRRFDIGAR